MNLLFTSNKGKTPADCGSNAAPVSSPVIVCGVFSFGGITNDDHQ
jgi:hypothetical protein